MSLQIETNYGYVKGIPAKGHQSVAAFLGVPYAREYSGRFRFQCAKSSNRWKGIKYCDGIQSERISVNIWTPVLGEEHSQPEKLPVLLFIPGLSELSDTPINAPYNGAALADSEQVVVCSITYRTGAFGFLDLSSIDRRFESNSGLKDQLIAIQWVYENIGHFGGDAKNITLAGSGEGGGDVMKLLTVPDARPYIARAFVTSPRYLEVVSPDIAAMQAREFLEKINAEEADAEELLNMPAERLTVPHTFNVVADGKFIKKDPAEAVADVVKDGRSIPLTVVFPGDGLAPVEESEALNIFLKEYEKHAILNVKKFDHTPMYMLAKGHTFRDDLDTAMFFNNPEFVYNGSSKILLHRRVIASKIAAARSAELGEYLRGMSFTLRPY